jgi:hypothetical protein
LKKFFKVVIEMGENFGVKTPKVHGYRGIRGKDLQSTLGVATNNTPLPISDKGSFFLYRTQVSLNHGTDAPGHTARGAQGGF